jgi:hypothetical protein
MTDIDAYCQEAGIPRYVEDPAALAALHALQKVRRKP